MILSFVMINYRCPTEPCSHATPFDNTTVITTPTPSPPSSSTTISPTITTTTTITPTTSHDHIPPLYSQICVVAHIKENFYSIIGNQYCVETCQGKPMDQCNLYLCYCTTQYVTTRGF